jgi:diadenosine tetraphosphate (Ap4A) HIT family hydrolase
VSDSCPLCSVPESDLVWSSKLVVSLRDRYPVSPGHTLVIPRRHVATYFEATPWEQQAIWQGVEQVKAILDASDRPPDGYNVGFNVGETAGQTVMHLHVHVIPRYAGDMVDPRGGVRGVIPDKQKYGDMQLPDKPAPDADEGPFGHLASFVPGEEVHFRNVLLS